MIIFPRRRTSSHTASMLSVLRSHTTTIVGGLALGGALGVGVSWASSQNDLPKDKPPEAPPRAAKQDDASLQAAVGAIASADGLVRKSSDGSNNERLTRWYERWASNNLGWHLAKPHPVLSKHLADLVGDHSTQKLVLFPLCGASVDLGYLARRGHHVVGVDAVPQAIDRLLAEYGEEIPSGGGLAPGAPRLRVAQPSRVQQMAAAQLGKNEGKSYEAAPFLFGVQADFIEWDAASASKFGLGSFDAAFDRGGLVAINPADRAQYADNLGQLIAPGGKLLLVTVEHEPAFGPPHSIDEAEVRKLLGSTFDIKQLTRENRLEIEPTWKARGATSFHEVAYMCTRRPT